MWKYISSQDIKIFQTQMKKKTKKAITNLPKENKNEKLSRIKLYQYLYLEEKEADQERLHQKF